MNVLTLQDSLVILPGGTVLTGNRLRVDDNALDLTDPKTAQVVFHLDGPISWRKDPPLRWVATGVLDDDYVTVSIMRARGGCGCHG